MPIVLTAKVHLAAPVYMDIQEMVHIVKMSMSAQMEVIIVI